MKNPRILIGAGLALALSIAAQAEPSSQAWLEHYYQNPEPSGVPASLFRLNQSHYFDQPDQVATAIGFYSTLFAQNPEKVGEWLAPSTVRDMPPTVQRVVACALWLAGNPRGAELLRKISPYAPNPSDVLQMADSQALTVSRTPVKSAFAMNLQWGGFLATGDSQYVVNVLDAIGRGQPGLDQAARYQLARNAAEHPRVMDICRSQFASQPEQVKAILNAAMMDAQSGVPGT